MAFSGEGSFSGAMAGAGTGAAIGSVVPGVGTAIGAGVGLFAGAIGGGFLGGKKKRSQTIDISAELAKIDALISAAREQARSAINIEANASRRNLASQLASRGVYRSPVAVNSFDALEGARLAAIGSSEAQLLGQGAQLRAGALGDIASMKFSADARNVQTDNQDRAALFSSLSSLGTSMFFNSPYFRSGQQQQMAAPGQMQTNNPNMIFDRNPRYFNFGR